MICQHDDLWCLEISNQAQQRRDQDFAPLFYERIHPPVTGAQKTFLQPSHNFFPMRSKKKKGIFLVLSLKYILLKVQHYHLIV